MTTLTRSVSGEQQNFSGNMEILPGIGRVEKISGKHEIFSGHCMKKSGTRHYLVLNKVKQKWDKKVIRLLVMLFNKRLLISPGYTQKRVYALRHQSIVLGQNMEKSRNLFIGKYPVLSPGHLRALCYTYGNLALIPR